MNLNVHFKWCSFVEKLPGRKLVSRPSITSVWSAVMFVRGGVWFRHRKALLTRAYKNCSSQSENIFGGLLTGLKDPWSHRGHPSGSINKASQAVYSYSSGDCCPSRHPHSGFQRFFEVNELSFLWVRQLCMLSLTPCMLESWERC